jgi:hypothetical protein
MAASGNGHLPPDVRRRRPGVHVGGAAHVSLARRPAPARPVTGAFALDFDHPDGGGVGLTRGRGGQHGQAGGDHGSERQGVAHRAILLPVRT